MAGFNLYRAARAQGPYVKVNPELVSSQGAGLGSEYQYTDNPGGAGRYYYKLEEVAVGGETLMHGPVAVDIPSAEEGPYRILAPMVWK